MPATALLRAAPSSGASTSAYVLVADDDPATRRFFGDGLRALGLHVHECADGQAALAQASIESFDLLLLDCRMPGAGAREVLAALRGDADARSADALAVATSAELTAEDRQQLLSQGFSEVLLKPCGLAALRPLLALARSSGRHAPLLDDTAAVVSSGDAATVGALRGLLREELALLYRELDALAADPARFAERLHRLRSSCGFCGASALSTQAARLQRQLDLDAASSGLVGPLERFRNALLITLEALSVERPRAG